MVRRLIRNLLYKPVIWLIGKYDSRPDRARVDEALSKLHSAILKGTEKKGINIPFDANSGKFIIFSDQHKGARDGADDFAAAEPNYLAALDHYYQNGFHFISLGDNEELWENTLTQVKKFNQSSFAAEGKFLDRHNFTKIFGNHDLYWDNDPFAAMQLKEIYQTAVKVTEGVILNTTINGAAFSIYCTHGHQGDSQSDGNLLSKLFVSKIWGPLQSYLRINPNLPSNSDHLKTIHNQMMYEWSARQKNLVLITGHTHQPVFESLTQLESLFIKLDNAKKENKTEKVSALEAEVRLHGYAVANVGVVRPTYFNSGCCCFDDGDITGIEISEGQIRLVKWDSKKTSSPTRIVLEERSLEALAREL
jgi:predicted phosphodiesterase